MNIIIVGAKGFIGSHAFTYFSRDKANHVFGIDKSPDELSQFKEIFSAHPVDAVINAAGSANVSRSMDFPADDFEANVFFHMQLLEIVKRNPFPVKYIYLSSAAVYGNPYVLPISESTPLAPISPYGWHKYYAEQICLEFAKLFGMKTASLRLFSVFGPGQKKLLFWDFYNKCRAEGNEIVLHGTGEETRDFIYISDVLLAIQKVLQNAPMKGETYNVACGQQITIRQVAEELVQELTPGKRIIFNGHSIPGYPVCWLADIGLLAGYGFSPEVSFSEGLQNTALWLKENG